MLLRTQIKTAWLRSIKNDYAAQRINSERCLQASVWSNLNKLLPPETRRMFIEPRMCVGNDSKQIRYPDLVICNTHNVIGIVELKYQPRGQPSFKKDIGTLAWLHKYNAKIVVSNTRFQGKVVDSRQYPFSKHVIYVWAGIHRPCSLNLSEYVGANLKPSFMTIHTETSTTGKPATRFYPE